jgi:hypothetical protein
MKSERIAIGRSSAQLPAEDRGTRSWWPHNPCRYHSQVNHAGQTGGQITAGPAIAGGVVYARTYDGQIDAIGRPARSGPVGQQP